MKDLVDKHTREMVAAGMGYVLAAMSEEPGWLHRQVAAARPGASLEECLRPAVETFMVARGYIAGSFFLADIAEREAHR